MQPTRFQAFEGVYKPFEFAMAPRKYPPKPLTPFEIGLRVILQYLNVDKAVALKRVCRGADSILKKELFEAYFPGIKPSLVVKQLVAREPAIKLTGWTGVDISFAFYGANATWICSDALIGVIQYNIDGSNRWIKDQKFLCQHDKRLYFLAWPEAAARKQGETAPNLVSFCMKTEKFQKPIPIMDNVGCNLNDVTKAFFKNGKLILSSVIKELECRLNENDVVIEKVSDRISTSRCSYSNHLEFRLEWLAQRLNTCALSCFDRSVESRKWQNSLRKKDTCDELYLCSDDSFVAVQYLTHKRQFGNDLANLDVFDHAGNKVVLISNMRIQRIHKIWLSHNFLIYHDFKNRSLIFWNLKLMRYVATLQLPKDFMDPKEVTITDQQQIKILGYTRSEDKHNLSILTYTMA